LLAHRKPEKAKQTLKNNTKGVPQILHLSTDRLQEKTRVRTPAAVPTLSHIFLKSKIQNTQSTLLKLFKKQTKNKQRN